MKNCRNCNCMKKLISNGTICHCRLIGVENGLVSFRERLVPFQENGCGRWTKYQSEKVYKQPSRFPALEYENEKY